MILPREPPNNAQGLAEVYVYNNILKYFVSLISKSISRQKRDK